VNVYVVLLRRMEGRAKPTEYVQLCWFSLKWREGALR
jgi:hypothetical protein